MPAKLYAILVGVNAYEDDAIASLRGPVADMRAVLDAVKGRLGFDHVEARLLASPGDGEANGGDAAEPARRNAILSAVRSFAKAPMTAEDTFLFAFAGHGVEVDGKKILLAQDSPIGGTLEDLTEMAVRVDYLVSQFNAMAAGQQIVLLDACRNNPQTGVRSIGGALGGHTGVALTRGVAVVSDRERTSNGGAARRAWISACGAGQHSFEHPPTGRGWFCHNLLLALDELSAEAGDPTIATRLDVGNWVTRAAQRMHDRAWRENAQAVAQTPVVNLPLGEGMFLPLRARTAEPQMGGKPEADAAEPETEPEPEPEPELTVGPELPPWYTAALSDLAEHERVVLRKQAGAVDDGTAGFASSALRDWFQLRRKRDAARHALAKAIDALTPAAAALAERVGTPGDLSLKTIERLHDSADWAAGALWVDAARKRRAADRAFAAEHKRLNRAMGLLRERVLHVRRLDAAQLLADQAGISDEFPLEWATARHAWFARRHELEEHEALPLLYDVHRHGVDGATPGVEAASEPIEVQSKPAAAAPPPPAAPERATRVVAVRQSLSGQLTAPWDVTALAESGGLLFAALRDGGVAVTRLRDPTRWLARWPVAATVKDLLALPSADHAAVLAQPRFGETSICTYDADGRARDASLEGLPRSSRLLAATADGGLVTGEGLAVVQYAIAIDNSGLVRAERLAVVARGYDTLACAATAAGRLYVTDRAGGLQILAVGDDSTLTRALPPHRLPYVPRQLAVCGSGECLATHASGNRVDVWNGVGTKAMSPLPIHVDSPLHIAFCGDALVCLGRDGSMAWSRAADGAALPVAGDSGDSDNARGVGSAGCVLAMSDGTGLAVATGGTVRVYGIEFDLEAV